MITFTVAGHPVTQGSKRAFVNRATGRAVLVEDRADTLTTWRATIRAAAITARGSHGPADGPVELSADFHLTRPASAPKRARTWPTRRRSGDIDKLARACLDALTGVLFLDDAQVVTLHATKDWAGPTGPGVTITVTPLKSSGSEAPGEPSPSILHA